MAPTNTRVAGPNGTRAVGGTSIAAPNAAGAAALLWSSLLAGGVTPTADEIRQQLMSTALDLGSPGFDMAYGAGLVRVDTDPPEIVPATPVPNTAVRGVTRAKFDAADGSKIAHWSLTLDGIPRSRGGWATRSASGSTPASSPTACTCSTARPGTGRATWGRATGSSRWTTRRRASR